MSETDRLINAYLDGELDDAGQRQLDAWLANDREHQRRFLRLVMDHRAIHDQLLGQRFHAGRRDGAASPRALRLSTRRKRRAHGGSRPGRIRWAALAASLALA